jgi:hypothetical protein
MLSINAFDRAEVGLPSRSDSGGNSGGGGKQFRGGAAV